MVVSFVLVSFLGTNEAMKKTTLSSFLFLFVVCLADSLLLLCINLAADDSFLMLLLFLLTTLKQ